MIDPKTIAVPPTPTAASTTAEWANYLNWGRIMSDLALAEASAAQGAAMQEAAAAQRDMAAAVRETGFPPSVTEATFLEAMRIVQGQPKA